MDANSLRVIYHPFNIVPVYEPYKLASTAPAKFTYRGGPLLTNVKVYTLFVGKRWQESNGKKLIAAIEGFFDYILKSALITQLAEYSVPKYKVGFGKHAASQVLEDWKPKKLLSDSQIRNILSKKTNSGGLYFLYLPSGVAVSKSKSCLGFCGYHDVLTDNIYYAVMPYPDCAGCAGNLSTFDALTCTSRHELCEAMIDPIPGMGWYNDAHGDIGDICAWKTKKMGKYTVQLDWSNKANACV